MSFHEFTIHVRTSTKIFSGTDDDVFIDIIGESAQTGWTKLDNPYKNDFERGNTDKFKLYFTDLGTINAVRLKKNGRDDWRVHSVQIDTTGGGKMRKYLFKPRVKKIKKKIKLPKAFSTPEISSMM
ncbi:Oidioi.mRNA.OKI2018_I69.XSR.g15108.t1.cds [Oikopleura dioica]|uniref:Oidioi.mRNA.OKI2018_I69.XSR.g15108.t1.cds n=1 Tax=Oikopleura dioica TaxID=34765 RepID=A0ABN7SDJ4_OIKDI|nr:Oidioi.mRNA.OKI2018_I69.XSR.g15108.t1.cds [Oikopleura dioica]